LTKASKRIAWGNAAFACAGYGLRSISPASWLPMKGYSNSFAKRLNIKEILFEKPYRYILK
jgi:hypothetical protein